MEKELIHRIGQLAELLSKCDLLDASRSATAHWALECIH